MVPALGIAIVFGSVAIGYCIQGGNPVGLLRIHELLMICGSSFGASLVWNRMEHLAWSGFSFRRAFTSTSMTDEAYLGTLVTLCAVFDFARRTGPSRLEADLDAPDGGLLLGRCRRSFPVQGSAEFVCDSLRLATLGRLAPFDVVEMLEGDLELGRMERERPVELARTVADSLPGFGIAAAVLGVVITMGAMERSPAETGAKVGSAMMGTFLGILLSYGFAGPVAERMAGSVDSDSRFFQVVGAGVASFVKGMPTSIAVEFARREIPPNLRPSYRSVEAAWRDEVARGRNLRQAANIASERSAVENVRIFPIRNTYSLR